MDNRKGVSCTVCSGSIRQTNTDDGHRLPPRINGTLTLSPLCPLRIWCGVVQLEAGGAAWRFLRQAGGPARHQQRSPASSPPPRYTPRYPKTCFRISDPCLPPTHLKGRRFSDPLRFMLSCQPKNFKHWMNKLCPQQTPLRSYSLATQNKHKQ